MSDDEIRGTLRSFILEKFLPGEAPETLADSTLLLTSGVITSITLLELVLFLETTYSISLKTEDLGAANLDSIDRMVALVQRTRAQAAPGSA